MKKVNFSAYIRKDRYFWAVDVYRNGKPFLINHLRFQNVRDCENHLKTMKITNIFRAA